MLEAIIAAGVPLGLAIIGFLMKLSGQLSTMHADLKSVARLVEKHDGMISEHQTDIQVLKATRHLTMVSGGNDN